jgi:hypothetical protein
MQNPPMSRFVKRVCPRAVATWLSRALLLSAVALGLAMVSDPAAATAQGQIESGVQSGASSGVGRAGLTLALNVVGAAHRSIRSWSEGTTEAVSLVAFGLGLLGMGQTLSWKRRRGEQAALVIDTAAPRAADEVLRPHDSLVTSAARRSARG